MSRILNRSFNRRREPRRDSGSGRQRDSGTAGKETHSLTCPIPRPLTLPLAFANVFAR
jgi:hypothetical protein